MIDSAGAQKVMDLVILQVYSDLRSFRNIKSCLN